MGRAGRPQVPGLGPGPRRPTGSSPPPPGCPVTLTQRCVSSSQQLIFGEFLRVPSVKRSWLWQRCVRVAATPSSHQRLVNQGRGWRRRGLVGVGKMRGALARGGQNAALAHPAPCPQPSSSPRGSGSCCPGLPVAPGGITSTPAPLITRCTLGSLRAFGVAASVLIPEL